MKKVDLKTLAKHTDKYIAVSEDNTRILAVGKTIKELERQLAKKKIKHAILDYIPPIDKALSPVCR